MNLYRGEKSGENPPCSLEKILAKSKEYTAQARKARWLAGREPLGEGHEKESFEVCFRLNVEKNLLYV